MRRLKYILLLFVVFLILGTVKDLLAQRLLKRHLAEITGLETVIGTVHVSVFHSTLRAKEVLLYNPEEFKDRNFVRFSDLFIDFNLSDVLRKEPHFHEIWLVVEELFITKNREGRLNLESLKTFNATPLQIDRLDFTLRRIIYKDNEANPPFVWEFNPRVTHTRFENLRNIEELVQVVFLRSLPKEIPVPSLE